MFAHFILLSTAVACGLAYHHASSYASVNNYLVPEYIQAPLYEGHHASSYAAVNNLAVTNGYYGNNELYGEHGYNYAHHFPKYQYKYGVEDHHTGDIKDQHEVRDGDLVKGAYSLHQPDGRIRTVHYTAGKHNGFNAHVTYTGHAVHPGYHHGY